MLREAFVSVVLAACALALAPSAPALPAGCDAVAFVEGSLQADAGVAGDAPDTPAGARPVLEDGYYSGYLSTVGHARADREDWYVYDVPAGIELMSANITWEFPVVPVYTVEAPTYMQVFTLTVYPPDGSAPRSVTPYDPTLEIPSPSPGAYLVRITATTAHELGACESGVAPPPAPAGTSQARNHGMYLGCDPLCAPAL